MWRERQRKKEVIMIIRKMEVSGHLMWVYTSDGVKRFVALLRASQMRVKALAAYLFILPTPASARVNARQKAWRGALCYNVQQC